MSSPRAPRARTTKSPSKKISEIAPGVYVGGWKDAEAFDGVRFCVLDEAPEGMPAATHVVIFNEDTNSASIRDLDRLAKEIATSRETGKPVLVFCGHGVRRSPLAGAWYLHRSEQLSLDDAYDRIRSVRPKIEHAREWVGNAAELE